MSVTSQETLHPLIKGKLEIQCPGKGKRDHETRQSATGSANGHLSKAGPVDLTLFSGERAQTQKRFLMSRPQGSDKAAQLDHTATIAAIPDHLENPGGTKAWILCQNFPDEVGIGIGSTGAPGLGVIESLGFHGKAYRVGVKNELAGNGSNFPVFGIK